MSNTRNICNYLTQKVTGVKDALHVKPDEAKKFILPVAIFAVGGTLFSIPSAAVAIFTYSTLPGNIFNAIVIGSVFGAANVAYGRNSEQVMDVKSELQERKSYASLVEITGEISSDLSKKLMPMLKRAFADSDSKGVVLKINSHGGSSVESSNLHNEILTLKRQYNKKVIAVGGDFLKGGAYCIACSADVIYVNPNTETGSIGVISRQIGAAESAKKAGVEARIHMSGPYKNRSEILLAETKEDGQKTEEKVKSIHKNFIAIVKASRGSSLKASEELLFSGDTWLGEEAVNMGLVDKLGYYEDILRKEFFVDNDKEYDSRDTLKDWFNISIQPKVDLSLTVGDQPFGLRM